MPNLPTSLDFPPALNVPTRLDAAGTGSLPRLNPSTTGSLPRLSRCLPLSLQTRFLPTAPLCLQTRLELPAASLLRIDASAPLSLPRLELVAPLSLPARLERFAARSLLRLGLFAARSFPRLELFAAPGLPRLELFTAPSLPTRLGLCAPLNLPRRIAMTLIQCALTSLEFSQPLNVSPALARRLFWLAHKCIFPTVRGDTHLRVGLRDVVPAVISQLPWGPWRTFVRDWIAMPSAE